MTFLGTRRNRHYEAGIQYYDHGQYELAVRELCQVLSYQGDAMPAEGKLARFYLGESYSSLADSHVQRQNWVAAEECLEKALEINPNYADLHYQLARVYFLTSRFPEALAQIGRALAINPAYARAIYLEGLVLYRSGSVEEGVRRILEAARLEPSYTSVDFDTALDLHRDAKYDEAATVFARVGAMCIDDVAERIRTAKDQMRLGNVAEAEATVRRIIETNPNYPDVHNLMGQIWLVKGEFLKAVNEFKAALVINPRFVAAHVNLGHACRRMGNEDAARQSYKHALALDPDNEEARDSLSAG